MKKKGLISSSNQLISVFFIFSFLLVGSCTNINLVTSSDSEMKDVENSNQITSSLQTVTINAADFETAVSDAELIDTIIFFEENINVQMDGISATHDYTSLNGIFATITPELYSYLETAWFVSSISEDGIIKICQDTLDWGVDAVDAEKVWGVGEDAQDIYPGNFTGAGIKVAVLDTGVDYTHPDLDDNYVGGYDFENGDSNPIDDHGHGTHCSGIIAAEDNGNGVIGVAPEASLYAVKVIDALGYGDISTVIAGIDWCIAEGINVISMSLGWPSGTAAFEDACIRARDAGIVMCISSGNDYGSLSYPAIYSSTIAVGAINSGFARASFSNYGPQLDVVAPGVNVYSSMPTYSVTLTEFPYYMNNDYDYMDGTSMACPMVAGVAALLFDKNASYSATEVRTILRDSATDLGSVGFDIYYGYGAVNAYSAIVGISTVIPPADTIDLPLIEDGTKYNWIATNSPYNVVTKTTFDGRTVIKNTESISLLDSNNYARTDAIDLSDWDGVKNITLNFIFRCTSSYSSSSVTNFRIGFYDSYTHTNTVLWSVSQQGRRGQTWISGYDSGWQEVTLTLNNTIYGQFAGTTYLQPFFGYGDGWATNWDQTTYLDYLVIEIEDKGRLRDFNWSHGDGSMNLEWKSPTDWNVKDYHVEKLIGENWDNLTTQSHIGDNETLQTYHDSNGPLYGDTFHYRVCAVNQAGINGSWTYLNESDGDGLIDELEDLYGTNKYNNDTDGDFLNDYEEIFTFNTNPLNVDTDSDGLIDWLEIYYYFTDPTSSDTDSDLIPDGFEIIYGLDPTNSTDASDDPDFDGLTNLGEHQNGTDLYDSDTDDDLLNDGDEVLVYFTDPLDSDSDDDGLLDGEEVAIGTFPNDEDSDDDTLLDGEEVDFYETNPLKSDTDADGIDDAEEVFSGVDGFITDPNNADSDGDGIDDFDEINDHNTSPINEDTDGDDLNDYAEIFTHGTDPLEADTDFDGLNDWEEVNLGNDGFITNPFISDTDDDGLSDYTEDVLNTDPTNSDSDGDGLRDGIEVNSYLTNPNDPDTDHDGLDDWEELNAGSDGFITNPLIADSDSDLIPDGWESINGFNPLNTTDAGDDPDEDGLTNLEEYSYGTNPNNADSDGDSYSDLDELNAGTDPLNPNSYPTPTDVSGFKFSILLTLGVLAFLPILYRIRSSKRIRA